MVSLTYYEIGPIFKKMARTEIQSCCMVQFFFIHFTCFLKSKKEIRARGGKKKEKAGAGCVINLQIVTKIPKSYNNDSAQYG